MPVLRTRRLKMALILIPAFYTLSLFQNCTPISDSHLTPTELNTQDKSEVIAHQAVSKGSVSLGHLLLPTMNIKYARLTGRTNDSLCKTILGKLSLPSCGRVDTPLPKWTSSYRAPNRVFDSNGISNACAGLGDRPLYSGVLIPTSSGKFPRSVNFDSVLKCFKDLYIVPSKNYEIDSDFKPDQLVKVDNIPILRNANQVNIFIGGFHISQVEPKSNEKIFPVETYQVSAISDSEIVASLIHRNSRNTCASGGIGIQDGYRFVHTTEFKKLDIRNSTAGTKYHFSGLSSLVPQEMRSSYIGKVISLRCYKKDTKNKIDQKVVAIAGAMGVVVKNVWIENTGNHQVMEIIDSNDDLFIDSVWIGDSDDEQHVFTNMDGPRIIRARGHITVTNSFFARSVDDAVNIFGGKGVVAMANPMLKAPEGYLRMCVLMNAAPQVGDILQAVRPESGQIDYLFEVETVITSSQTHPEGCQRLNSASGLDFKIFESFDAYFLKVRTVRKGSFQSPNTSLTKFWQRYSYDANERGLYSKDLPALYNNVAGETSGAYTRTTYKNFIRSRQNPPLNSVDACFDQKRTNPSLNCSHSFPKALSEHYVVYNMNTAGQSLRIENNVAILLANAAFKFRTSNAIIKDNVIIATRNGGIHSSQVIRGPNIEGPLPANVSIQKNHVWTTVEKAPVEAISEGWNNVLRGKSDGQAPYQPFFEVTSDNECWKQPPGWTIELVEQNELAYILDPRSNHHCRTLN